MVNRTAYAPAKGNVIWLEFDPRVGREQSGRRPAIVLSEGSYNVPSGLAIVCPITSKVKGYPFELPLPAGAVVQGVVLADQVKSVDWRVRKAEFIGTVDQDFLDQIIDRLANLI